MIRVAGYTLGTTLSRTFPRALVIVREEIETKNVRAYPRTAHEQLLLLLLTATLISENQGAALFGFTTDIPHSLDAICCNCPRIIQQECVIHNVIRRSSDEVPEECLAG